MKYFTKGELTLWLSSLALIIISFFMFSNDGYLTLTSSLIGATALIFCAKGNPFGQILMIIFCVLYGIISLSARYYGELMTYVLMSLPMAVISLITWFKNPFEGSKSQVKVNKIKPQEYLFLFFLAALVTLIFYFILKYFNTANLIPSTLSVTTSFIAAYLAARRSPYYALAYGVNDIVLIILWGLASIYDVSYISVLTCFVVFLANDLYGFAAWIKMEKTQQKRSDL